MTERIAPHLLRFPALLFCGFVCILAVLLAGCTPAWPRSSVTVEWTTASEVDHAGFNLYRSESPAGPWVKLNPQPIPPAGDPIVGGKYSYVDDTVEPGRTYYYQLEDVALNGATTSHPPIQVTAGRPGGGWWELAGGAAAGIALAAVILAGWWLWQRMRQRQRIGNR
jgi:hypothetical protein